MPQRRIRVVILYQGDGATVYAPSGLSVLFERMSPAEVQGLIVDAASARLHRLTGPRRVQRENESGS